MKTTLTLVLLASLTPDGHSCLPVFDGLGGLNENDKIILAAATADTPDLKTISLAIADGYYPSQACLGRLAYARRHGDAAGKRIGNLFANLVAGRSWKPDAKPLTHIEQQLLDSRDLALV